MSNINDGGPAFPVPVLADKEGSFVSCHQWKEYMVDGGAGMTLRDYFAGEALKAVMADPWYNDGDKPFTEVCDYIAKDAYTIADAMLRARNQPRGQAEKETT